MRTAVLILFLCVGSSWGQFQNIVDTTPASRSLLRQRTPDQMRDFLGVGEGTNIVASTIESAVGLTNVSSGRTIIIGDLVRGGIFCMTNTVASTNRVNRIAMSTPGWSIQRIYSGPLDIRWAGAIAGDGLDDTEAIQHCIDSLPDVGGTIFIPVGEWTLASNLILDRKVTIFGEGTFRYSEVSRLTYTGADTAITIASGNVTLKNFAVVTTTGIVGINVVGFSDHTFETMWVQGFSNSQFMVHAFWTVWDRCIIQAATTDNSTGIKILEGFNASHILRSEFTAAPGVVWTAIDIGTLLEDTSTGSSVTGNTAHGGAPGSMMIHINPGCYGISVTDNRMESSGGDFLEQEDGSFGTFVAGNQVAGSTSTNAANLMMFHGGGATVVGNTLMDSTNGIVLAGDSRRVFVAGNEYLATVTNSLISSSSLSTTTTIEHEQTTAPRFRAATSTLDAPGYSFKSDTNSGLHLISAGVVSILTDGLEAIHAEGTNIFIGPLTADRDTPAALEIEKTFAVSDHDYIGQAAPPFVGGIIASDSGNAGLKLMTLNASATSDPYIQFITSGGATYHLGIDNSASDVFVIGRDGADPSAATPILVANTDNNVVIGSKTSSSTGAALEVNSTTKAFLLPRMDNTARDAIANVTAGMVIYSTTDNQPQFYDGDSWESMAAP